MLDESGDFGRRRGRVRDRGPPAARRPADGDSLRIDNRLDGMAVGGRQRPADLDGRPGPPPVQLDAGAALRSIAHQQGPQPVQLLEGLVEDPL